MAISYQSLSYIQQQRITYPTGSTRAPLGLNNDNRSALDTLANGDVVNVYVRTSGGTTYTYFAECSVEGSGANKSVAVEVSSGTFNAVKASNEWSAYFDSDNSGLSGAYVSLDHPCGKPSDISGYDCIRLVDNKSFAITPVGGMMVYKQIYAPINELERFRVLNKSSVQQSIKAIISVAHYNERGQAATVQRIETVGSLGTDGRFVITAFPTGGTSGIPDNISSASFSFRGFDASYSENYTTSQEPLSMKVVLSVFAYMPVLTVDETPLPNDAHVLINKTIVDSEAELTGAITEWYDGDDRIKIWIDGQEKETTWDTNRNTRYHAMYRQEQVEVYGNPVQSKYYPVVRSNVQSLPYTLAVYILEEEPPTPPIPSEYKELVPEQMVDPDSMSVDGNYFDAFSEVFFSIPQDQWYAHVELTFDERDSGFENIDGLRQVLMRNRGESWRVVIDENTSAKYTTNMGSGNDSIFLGGEFSPEYPFKLHIYVGNKPEPPKPDPMFDSKWTKNFVSDSVDNSDAGELKTIIRQKKGTVTGHNVNELLQDLQGCLDNGGEGGGGDQEDTTVTLVKEQSLTYESVDFDGWTGNAAKLEVEDAFVDWINSMPNVNNIRSNNTPYFPWNNIHVVLNGEDTLYKAAMDYEGETYIWVTCRDGDQFAVSKTTDDVYFLPINEPTSSDKVYIYQTKEDIDSYNNGTYLVEIILNEQGENNEGYKHVLVGTKANDVIESLKFGKPVNVAFARVNGGDFSIGYVAYFTTGSLTLVSGFNDDGTFDKKVYITYDPEYLDQKYPEYFVFYDSNIAPFPLTSN